MIWFTSDFHFGHEKEFLWGPRGYSNWAEASESVVNNYNSVVSYDDTVYILGDCMLSHPEFGISCLKRLNGNKHLIVGNHDTDEKIKRFYEEEVFKSIEYGGRLRYGKYSFWMSHFPMEMGVHKSKHPVWNLSGHTHSNVKIRLDGCIYNVCLNAHKNFPVNIETIVEDIEREVKKLG